MTERLCGKHAMAITRDRRDVARSELLKRLDWADNAARQRPDDRQLAEICKILRSEGVAHDAAGSAERADAMTALVRLFLDAYKLDR